jgi:hypothetical protein
METVNKGRKVIVSVGISSEVSVVEHVVDI